MSLAKMTLIQMYQWNNTLFDGITPPSDIDKDTLINTILLECGEFEPLYASPDFMKQAIAVWYSKWQRTIEKWVTALSIEYDPLYNYDRHEEYTDINKQTASGNSSNTGSDSATREDKKSSYDSSDYQPFAKSTENGNTTSNFSNSNKSDTEVKHDAHLYGNIGVTTSQQMLEAELEVAKFNLYNNIMDLFKTELVLAIY